MLIGNQLLKNGVDLLVPLPILALLDYDIDYNSTTNYPRHIKLTTKRKKIIFDCGLKNIFLDKTIMHGYRCGCCLKESGKKKPKINKSVSWSSFHIIGPSHKQSLMLSDIIDELKIIEFYSLFSQGFNFQLLQEVKN